MLISPTGDAGCASGSDGRCLFKYYEHESHGMGYVYDMGSSTIVELKVEDEVVYPGDLCYHTQWEDDPYMQSLSSTDPGAEILRPCCHVKEGTSAGGTSPWNLQYIC
eukprot:1158098-Pelagomonas_calceolata.AAC.3